MPRKQVGAIDADLLAEVDKRAEWLGQTRRVFIERAAEQALSEAKEPSTRKQSGPGSVPSSEGVRSAAPAEEPCEHQWRNGPTLDMNPPINSRTCRKCGRSESQQDAPYGDGRWHVTRRPYRQHVPGPNVEGIRSSSQSKRDVRPIPKKGER